jgi:hypothetical protein
VTKIPELSAISYRWESEDLDLDLHTKAFDLRKIAEYEMVRRGFRDADVFHMKMESFDKDIEKITNDDMFFLPLDRIKLYKGVSYSHEISENLIPNETFVYGVIARELSAAQQFKSAYVAKDHIKMGKLLGYPECCCNFFYNTRSVDPVFEVAQGTRRSVDPNYIVVRGDNPLLRTHLKYFGFRLIPWSPCSTECKESSIKVQDWISVMRSIDEKTTNKIIEILNVPSNWSLLKSQVFLDHPLFWAFAPSYSTETKLEVLWG